MRTGSGTPSPAPPPPRRRPRTWPSTSSDAASVSAAAWIRSRRDGGGSLGNLFRWWLETYSQPRTSHVRDTYTVRSTSSPAPIARLKLVEITPGVIERFLQAKATTHGPQTLNHLRRYVLSAFNCARRAERYMGPNPAKEVLRRTVPKRKPDFLRVDEVPRVLAALEDRWRPLFAAAIYTGLRKGELLGLTKAKVDLRERLLYVARSYDRLTNKSKREEVIPIATEVIPFLEMAIQASPSELVFPGPDGSMMREDVDIENVLRRAHGRAGIVLGYQHICRRKGCGLLGPAPGPGAAPCPTCNMKLWPKALVRKDSLSRSPSHDGQPAAYGRGEPGRRAADPPPQRSADHDRGLRPPRARLPPRGDRSAPIRDRAAAETVQRFADFGAPFYRACYICATAGPIEARRGENWANGPNDFEELSCGRGRTRTCYPRLRRPFKTHRSDSR